MRHRVTVKKLSKTPAHRKAMLRNMLVALYKHEQIKTTHAKSKFLQRTAEKLITRAKNDTVHNRRIAAKWVQDKDILKKLFEEIGPRFKQRPGGYTRITKIGQRYGDASEMVYIGLVEDELPADTKSKKKDKESKKKQPQQSKSDEATAVEKSTGVDSKVPDDAKASEAETAVKEAQTAEATQEDTVQEESIPEETLKEDSTESVTEEKTEQTDDETVSTTAKPALEEEKSSSQTSENDVGEEKPSN